MQTIIQQARQALQQGQFETCRSVICEALGAADDPSDRLVLLEMLAEAQAGLDDRARLFERACQSYEQAEKHAALERLAQAHGRRANTSHERAKSLLIAGDALMRQQRHREARQRYFEPLLGFTDMRPEMRAYLCYDMGLCYLAEQNFAAAAEAFRTSLSIPLAVRLPTQLPPSPAHFISVQQLQNAAHFYGGIIHLMHHQPDQAVQALKQAQPSVRTGTKLERANTALFLALAHCRLGQPDAAEHALRTLPNASELPGVPQAPQALIRAGIANLRQDTIAVGEHIDKALGASLRPRATWEPCWRALLYEELGQALYRSGMRQAAMAAYEEALKVLAHRMRPWRDALSMDWLRGHSLFSALDNLPLHTWPASVVGDMLRLLQRLIGLYSRTPYDTLADLAFEVALRLPATPMQRAALWLQYSWLTAIQPGGGQPDAQVERRSRTACIEGVQVARAQCPHTSLALALGGVEALLNGDEAVAQHAFAQVAAIPEAPEVEALGLATWLWAHASRGQLGKILELPPAETPPRWRTGTLLADAFALLLDWATHTASPTLLTPETWLMPLLERHQAATSSALRFLMQPHALPEAQRLALQQILTRLCMQPANDTGADEAAALLGGEALLHRLDVLLAALDQCHRPAPMPSKPPSQRRKSRQRHQGDTADATALYGSRLRHLIERLSPEMLASAGDRHLPGTIHGWLVQYPDLGSRAPEVVGALLRLLSKCPTGHAVIPAILTHVALSKRQRQALETAAATPAPMSAPAPTWSDWEAPRAWPLAPLLKVLSTPPGAIAGSPSPASNAYTWYILALIFCRVGLHARASDCLQTCLRLEPNSPLAHYQLTHLLRQQQRYETALHHAFSAWRTLPAQVPTASLLHLDMLNLIFVLLGITARHDHLPGWFATFARFHAELQTAPLNDDERRHLREEEGRLALSQALHLWSLPPGDQTPENLERQLDFLAQAIAKGPPTTQHFALHRQADALRRLQREDAAVMTYAKLIQQWPHDRHARFRLSLLTAVRQATANDAEADHALAEALALAFADAETAPSPLTPQSALDWLQRAAPYVPSYVDVTDVLTAYGHMLLKRLAYVQAIDILTPLYARVAEPRQAYYLAKAHYACSQQEIPKVDRHRACQRALTYAHAAVASVPHQQQAQTLLQQIKAAERRLAASQRKATTLAAYRQQVIALFTRYGVPHVEQVTEQPAEAPWLALYEHADLEESSGNPVVTVQLNFNRHAHGDTPSPSTQEVLLYAQHQQAAQQVVQRHGVASLTWPPLNYDGETPFESIFSERLALNRDLLVVAYAEPKCLARYARLLQVICQPLETFSLSTSRAIAAARYVAVTPLVHQRLYGGHQGSALQASAVLAERLQSLPAFADAYRYFAAVATHMQESVETPHGDRPTSPAEKAIEQRQKRRIRDRDTRDDTAKRKRYRKWANRSPHAAPAMVLSLDR